MTKIISLQELHKQSRKNKKIVLVTGCFDILHSEHKKFLQSAKKQGDILLIGIESDSRIKKLKGYNRPINTINVRLQSLAKWEIADYIFSLPEKFNQTSQHITLINQIKPDILAVSSHTPNILAKQKILASIGGKLKIVYPHNPNISTTNITKEYAIA